MLKMLLNVTVIFAIDIVLADAFSAKWQWFWLLEFLPLSIATLVWLLSVGLLLKDM